MAVLYYRYQSIRPDAITSNLLRSSNGQLFDVAGRPQSPYNTNEMFAVAPIRQAVAKGNNKIIFRPELFVGNTGKTVSALAIDVNATGTWQAVVMNTAVTINFANEGFSDINIRITYTDGTQKLAHTKLAVYNNFSTGPLTFSKPIKQRSSLCAVHNFRFSPLTYGDNPLAPTPKQATKPYLGTLATGDITIEYASSNTTGQIRKPLIVVEGFDLNNSYNYAQFALDLRFDANPTPGVNITLNNNLDNTGVNAGDYDIIFLNFTNATDYIQRNAYLLEKVIQDVNTAKTVYNGVRQQNVILGLSLGGVIARYALKDMENSGLNHETRLFIAHDSPFKGANIPVGFQIAAQHLGPWKIINGAPHFPFIRYVDLVPEVTMLLNAYNSPAAKQVIIQRYDVNTTTGALTANNTAYNNFQTELNSLGWPANCRNITVSNGSCNGTKAITTSNANFFQIAGERNNMTYAGALWRSLALTLGGILTPTGVLTDFFNHPQPNAFALLWEFPLTTFSTKTSLGLNFSCNAIPTTGTAEIYRGQVYSTKKVLGLFNITSNFINLVASSQSGMVPLDEAPGGVYDLEKFGFDPTLIQQQLPSFFQGYISATVNQASFCFIPTVSSIAHNNASSSWFNAVCGTAECVTPSQVADFYLQNNNQLHISYTQANGDWLMQRQAANFSCIKTCAANFSITGSNPLCTSGTYTLTNVPSTTPTTWALNPNYMGTVAAGPTANSANITKSSAGDVTIAATITNACTSNNTINRVVHFGGYGSSDYPVTGPSSTSCNYYVAYTTNQLPGATSYTWFYPGTWTYVSGQGTYMLTLIAKGSTSNYQVGVRVANTCDAGGSYAIRNTFLNGCAGAMAYQVSPNPATTDVTISPVDDAVAANSTASKTATNTITEVNIFDQQGVLKKQQKFGNAKTAKVNVSSLRTGVYFIEIIAGNYSERHQLSVLR